MSNRCFAVVVLNRMRFSSRSTLTHAVIRRSFLSWDSADRPITAFAATRPAPCRLSTLYPVGFAFATPCLGVFRTARILSLARRLRHEPGARCRPVCPASPVQRESYADGPEKANQGSSLAWSRLPARTAPSEAASDAGPSPCQSVGMDDVSRLPPGRSPRRRCSAFSCRSGSW